MIQYPSRIFFSRWEKQDEDNKWLYTSAHTLAVHAKHVFFKNYSSEIQWWKEWNVIELHGHQSPTCISSSMNCLVPILSLKKLDDLLIIQIKNRLLN